jgi:hypothetical protein
MVVALRILESPLFSLAVLAFAGMVGVSWRDLWRIRPANLAWALSLAGASVVLLGASWVVGEPMSRGLIGDAWVRGLME